MALAFLDNINYLGKLPNFSRDQFDTKADMKAFSDNYLPETFIATCIETGKAYLYNKSNSVDPDLGKWRELGSGGGSEETSPAPTPVKDKFFYYGASSTDTGIALSSLTKAKLETASTKVEITATSEYVVFAVPKAGGDIDIYDDNGLCYTSSFNKSTVNDGTEDYYLYVSDTPTFCIDFVYKIKY